MSSVATAPSLTASKLIRTHYDALQELPSPAEDDWEAGRLTDQLCGILTSLIQAGAVKQADSQAYHGHRRWTYRTDERFWDALQDYTPETPLLPCGHRGISNLRDGGYACAADWCDAEFPRETVEEVLADGR